MTGDSFESSRFVKNSDHLSKSQRNRRATGQSGTVDFFFSGQSVYWDFASDTIANEEKYGKPGKRSSAIEERT